ncbi:serine threonine-protein kinase BRI1-like [Seminavis robusta]|uniref:Serine threonine-protein kinase BRI1-like n=1 Tax=Seminavis robusta TaxID=568900 RepID=A0A9N8HNB4_9STRA|nr:serine threonine-protein kinase BRI1-like [Seminavis robusta]|eukprot:Sro979_g227240.1 serine threonine-protein kinase BRI1-like (653) ;mRNA; f:17298-19601
MMNSSNVNDNSDAIISVNQENTSTPSLMEPIEGPGLEDDMVHDQLPTVDEAKANLDLATGDSISRRTPYWRWCFYCFSCICCAFILLIILAFTVGAIEEKEAMKHSQGDSNLPPKLAPGTYEPRTDFVRQYLSKHSDVNEMMREGSPQYWASKWIADEDIFHLPVDDEAFVERYALAVFYFAMNGPKWPLHLGFLAARKVCDWNRIGFGSDDKPRYVGAHCTKGEKVHELFFPEKWLHGVFPDEMSLLSELRFISVYRNPDVGGKFPEAVRKIPKLEYLALHFCDLEGTIPSWIGEMTALTSLVLSNNDLTGTLPSEVGLLTGLNQLFLDDNRLQGDIKMLEPLTNLEALLLEDNQFHGNLTDPMMFNWQHMQIMDLSNNNLTSTIPPGFFALKNLSVADIHSNQLTGSLPVIGQTNNAFKFLALHDNKLKGQIPNSMGRLEKMSHLDLSNNLFTGTLPASFGNMTNFKYLFLSMNKFAEGKIPSFLQKLTNLEDLSLKATQRTGILPHWLGFMHSLVLLDLDSNQLQGTIPRALGDLTNLKFLLLNSNKLHGSIPQSFEKLSKIDFLMLEDNNLNGTAKHVCDKKETPQVFVADCEEIKQCTCCTLCCSDNNADKHCDDDVWLGGVDPIWESQYERAFYQFEKVKLKKHNL